MKKFMKEEDTKLYNDSMNFEHIVDMTNVMNLNERINSQINIEICEPDDDYEHVDGAIDYIIENVLMEKPRITTSKSFENLSNLYNSFYDTCCNCSDSSNDCTDIKACYHGGCYSKDTNENELILNKHRNVKDLLYECNSQCPCLKNVCTNRLVQFGPRKHLKIVNSTNLINQLGLSTDKVIPEGGFICEYAGEVLTESEALKRNIQNRDQNLKNYLICLNEYSTIQSTDQRSKSTDGQSRCQSSGTPQCIQTFIDAGRKSNIGRYLNHSCDPNCEILSVRIDGPIPKLGIFARKKILTSEELCFDYGDVNSVLSNKQICLCGTAKCRKYF